MRKIIGGITVVMAVIFYINISSMAKCITRWGFAPKP